MQNVKAARALNVTAARSKKNAVHRSPTVHHYNGNGNFFMTPTVHVVATYIGTKRKPLTKAGSPNILVRTCGGHVRRFPSCTRLLVSPCATSPDIHARVTFAAYNRMV